MRDGLLLIVVASTAWTSSILGTVSWNNHGECRQKEWQAHGWRPHSGRWPIRQKI